MNRPCEFFLSQTSCPRLQQLTMPISEVIPHLVFLICTTTIQISCNAETPQSEWVIKNQYADNILNIYPTCLEKTIDQKQVQMKPAQQRMDSNSQALNIELQALIHNAGSTTTGKWQLNFKLDYHGFRKLKQKIWSMEEKTCQSFSVSNFNLTYTERAITDYTLPYYLDHRSQMLDNMMSSRIWHAAELK